MTKFEEQVAEVIHDPKKAARDILLLRAELRLAQEELKQLTDHLLLIHCTTGGL